MTAKQKDLVEPLPSLAELRGFATACGATMVTELKVSAQELEGAAHLLADAFDSLRDGVFGATPGAPGSQVVIALQSEDAIGQMLDGVRRRLLGLAEALSAVSPAMAALSLRSDSDHEARPAAPWIAHRVQNSLDTLQAIGRHPFPVAQRVCASGSIDLF